MADAELMMELFSKANNEGCWEEDYKDEDYENVDFDEEKFKKELKDLDLDNIEF